MTREEAKEELILSLTDNHIPDPEAVEMAIKALEQEPCEEELDFVQEHKKISCNLIVEPCEDAISRQAVINTLDNIDNVLDEDRTIENYKELLKECYEVLPPVNPQPKIGHWIFDEILDKHYYCSECKSMGVDYWDFCPNCGAKMVEPQERNGEE